MKVMIFGCGQAGRMAANWLAPNCQLIAFTDNNQNKWNGWIDSIPVVSPAQIPELAPDLIWIAVLNREAASSIETQLHGLGYTGKIQSLTPLRSTVDLRLAHLRLIAREITDRNLPGAVAELGVYQGTFAAEINRLFPDRKLYLFDTFQGFPLRDLEIEAQILASADSSGYTQTSSTASFRPGTENEKPRTPGFHRNFNDTDIDTVLSRLPHPEQAVLCPGYFPETLPEDLPELAFVSLDADLYEPTRQGLLAFWPRLVPGGIILIHDYNSTQFEGAGRAVREFCTENHLMTVPLADLHGSAVLLKQCS